MKTKISKKITLVFLFAFMTIANGNESNDNRIEVLVDENIITKYDIVQRIKINSILNRIEITDDNYNQLIKAVIDDLITEKLKNKKINEYNISFIKDEYEKYESQFYSRIDYEKDQLKEIFSLNNVNYKYLRKFIEIELKWQKLIYGLYLRVTSVTEQEISDLISKNPNMNKEIAKELILQKQLDIKSTKLIKDLRDEATIEYK